MHEDTSEHREQEELAMVEGRMVEMVVARLKSRGWADTVPVILDQKWA